MLILNMATEIKSLGERIDIRLTKIETRMDDWDKRFCNIEEKLTKCIESQQATEKLASCNSLKVNELEARVEFFETRLREPNLVFYGIEREGDENQADCNLKIQNIIRDKMEIGDDLKITKCHRLSRGSNAPVLVVVPDYADRAKIFKNAYKLRDTKISISKDYSKNVREQRRILIAKRKELGERGIKSKLRDNKLLLPLTSERRAKDHIISSLSNKLLDFLEDNSLTIVNGRSRGDKDGDFTYISERGSSTIDYCILSQGSLQILLDFKVDDQLYSDHHPLVLTIKGQNFNEKKTKREDYNITRYRWSADGLATFKMKLEELREKNIPASDDLVYTFNQRILEAMSSAKITYSIKGGPRKSKPWFDKDCYDMKKLAKESLKKYRKTNRLEDRECYASSRKKYLALLDLKRKGFDNEKQEILRNAKDSKTFWKTIALYKSTSIIQGEISIQDWLNFYRELMTTEKNLRICNLHNVISQNDPILDSEITNADIYKEIAGLRSNKACGPDGIPNEVLKTLPDSYILLLKQLYNSVMTTGKYPAIWTNSTIHPIFKNGYKNSPSNYRGIALISNVSKLFTSILRSRLEEWVEGRRVIPENQAGFRKERSCIDHIFTLTTLIQLSLRKKRGKLYVFFVDLRKAFDTVPHSLLWKKLYNLGISYQFISTIKSYYEQATIAIRWKGSFTESIKINSGVLQGEPLSPLLFILFITDLIEIYNNSDLPSVNLPEFGDIHLLLYADDIAIIGESRINLQKKIKILKEYLDENLMTLNESKSKIMVFRNGGKPSNKDRWFWNDKPIAITSRYTYLGFPLTPTITTTHPANYFKGKALTAINATHPILIKSKAKSINLSIKLFDTIVRAVLMYAAPLWATEHKDLLDNIQDIFIRRFLNLPRYTPGYLIRLETGRISLSVTALKLTLKYWLRVLNMSSDRLPRICFNRTRELSNASGTPIGFIKKLTNLLNDNGSPALVSCDDPETLRSAITGLLKTAADQSIQNDLTRMDKSKLYSHYKDIHISFMTEGYLLGDFPFPVVRLLAQVRILSSFFRENHTKMLCGEDPTCTFCNSKLQNEITHYIFDCSALKEERRTLMLKTGQLCASLPSIIDNMTQNKYIATAFYGFHKSISQKKAKPRGHGCCDLHFRRLGPGFHRRVKAKTSLQDDDVPIDDTTAKPLFTPQEKDAKVLGTKFQDFDGILDTSDPYQDFEIFVKCSRFAFAANDTSLAKQVPVLLAVIGPKLFKLAEDLAAPEKLETKSFDEIVALLNKHLAPTPRVIPARYNFFKSSQEEETISQFMATLRGLAEPCKFGSMLNEMLRDKLVVGVRSENLQKRLLQEGDDATLDKIYEIALSYEAAERDLLSMKKVDYADVNVHDVKKLNSACSHCGRHNHLSNKCFFKNAKCHECGKIGHIKPACKNRKTKYAKIQNGSKATRKINVVEASKNGKYFITLNVDNKNIQFEFDTGSCHTLMPINLYKKLWNKKIFPINLHLKSYSNTKIDVIGKREVFVAEANKTLPLIITEANRSVLLGTTWIKCLPAKFLKFSDINLVQETTCSSLVNKFAEVFGTSNVGVIKDHKAHLILRKDANPRFFRARNVPYVMRNAIEKELENLEAQGVITKIERSDWATPIVPIMKKNGHVRICGDFKITLNPVLKIDQYPLPKIEDIFAILGRGINFSKIDLSQAYLQLELDEKSKEMAVINTHKGLYRYNRLPFGIASAPAIWQRIIEQILSGIPGTLVYLDDILITGESEADHLGNLEAVLNRLNEYGLKANRDKCKFFQESLEYCGHVIDKMGLHKINDKIRAVLDAPKPLNVTQLRAFLGLVTYYHKFIRNAADVLSPLYALLKKGTKWHWSTECRKAFREIKEIISSDQILIAYDPKLPIRLSCDSSSYRLGAVLSQIDVDGNERPIYFISRTLSQAEKKYSQIDKECLSIIWALKKFNNYLFGRKFELITDTKPLHHILNPKREISSNMSARLQRWALNLSSYNFTIECRKTGDHGNADGLSRLPLKQYEEMEEDAVNTVHMIKQCEELPLTSSHIRRESCKDSILKIVYQNTLYGWKDKPSHTELLSFYLRREELTVEQGILLLGTRVVIPRKFRAKIKAELHQGHLGVVKMKALARNFIWWPGIDREIEEITRVCRECNINNHTLKQESVHRWESAPTPWYRIHLDFAGPFMNRMFLIVIDSYSKWPEVIIMNSTTAGNTIRVLRDLFSRYGIPDQVVTDNGPQFVSEEMKYIFKSNGVHHLRSAPYFPATNGLAERFVQTLKRGLKNMRNEELNKSLANFLFTYRTVPHSSTREAPAVLFLKRMLKFKWNLLKPKLEVKPGFKKGYSPDFEEDENILVRDFLGPNKWKEGKIIKRLGKCFYTVKLNDGRLWRRHVCQLRKNYIVPSPAPEIFLPEQLIKCPSDESRAEDGSVEIPASPSEENIPSSPGIPAPEEPGPAASDQDRTPQRRYPMRDRRPPERFGF
ncbi:K02A2.6-like [Cordylochernes scorpioides]|uniref:RNA-directed DNA polymerase n=1 Tax=Cordylochernes scorpioides TaxID=51811 RepID=A0ABY6LAY6_9ARAC|nr:K02A2.6-like [Cordylochernes scorpioides]